MASVLDARFNNDYVDLNDPVIKAAIDAAKTAAANAAGTTSTSTSTPTSGTDVDNAPFPDTKKGTEAKEASDLIDAAKQDTEGYTEVKDKLLGAIDDPEVPEAATQDYTPLELVDDQLYSTDQSERFFLPTEYDPETGEELPYSRTAEQMKTLTATTIDVDDVAYASAGNAYASQVQAIGDTKLLSPRDLENAIITAPPGVVAETMQQLDDIEAKQGLAAQIDIDAYLQSIDTQPEQMQAVVATLPEEALVTGQLSNLLKGLEGGDVPLWARPVVENVEQALERRGIGKSNIGRDALFNAIVSAAMPLAQSNAQAIQHRANLNLGFLNEAQKFNAGLRHEMKINVNDKVALFVGQNASFRQQMELANLDASNRAQLANLEYEFATNKANMDSRNIAKLENMRAELQVRLSNQDMQTRYGLAEMDHTSRAYLLDTQTEAQRLIFNADAQNIASRINANNRTQVNMFNAEVKNQVDTFNANAMNAAAMYNTDTFNSMLQFDQNLEFQRDHFNASMYNIIEQSNVNWKRQINTINTAGENAVNQANAMNAFNLNAYALNTLWQESRDNANFIFTNSQNLNELAFRTMIASMESQQFEKLQKQQTGEAFSKFVVSWLGSLND